MKAIPVAWATIFLLAVPCAELRAQAPAATPRPTATIGSIKVTGAQKFPADQIITASGLKTGETVTADQIQEATNHLTALGLFSEVKFKYVSKGETINLEFHVQEAPTYPILFDNFPWLTDAEIGAAIRNQVGLFTGESPDSGTIVDQMAAVIEGQLSARNIKGSVTHQLLAAPVGDGMVMQFKVEDATLRIQAAQFGDSLASDSERLKDRISDIKGQPYSRFAIEIFENEQVRPIYSAKGFLRVQIGPPEPKLVPDAYDPKQMAVEVSIPIRPGPAYTWKEVSWQGNEAMPLSNLDKAMELKPGDVADGMKIEASWQKVEASYGEHGFLDMNLDPKPQFNDAAHEVSYQVRISEGPQYRMGDMLITGLSVDAERRLRQAWQISPGQIFDKDYYESHVKILRKPTRDIFGDLPVHYNEFGYLLRPDTSRHTVDVLLDFK